MLENPLSLSIFTAPVGQTSEHGCAKHPWQPLVTYTLFSTQPWHANLIILINGGV